MKILFNSYPLSGHIQVCSTILRITRDITKDNPEQMAEYDNWSIWKQEPIFFTGQYDASICFVIRDPLEVISLNVDRWFGGHSEKRVFNKEAADSSMKRNHTTLIDQDIEFINHQVRIYKSYIMCYEKSKQPILVTSYNKYINDTKAVVLDILKFANVDEKLVNLNELSTSHDIEKSETALYDQIKQVISNHPDYKFIKSWYDDKIKQIS